MPGNERRIMFVFPGQGSQYRGMGSDIHREYAIAREIYHHASEVLGYDMAKLSFEDPKDEIRLTRYTQPALMTHQVACLKVFEDLSGGSIKPVMAAGHSLGEYTALLAAGSLTLEEGLRLVQRRAELMGNHGEGGMLALTMDVDTARRIADKHYCQIASCNLPKQTVVGGHEDDLEALAMDMAENYPRKRAVRLATKGAFHTYFMVTAARLFREVLDTIEFAEPKTQVLSNYTAGMHDGDPESIRTRLFFQLFNPVNWVGCLQTAMEQRVDTFVEFGGGLGKTDGPTEKRPSLESVIKKTMKVSSYEADYVAAINCETIQAAVQQF